MLTIRNFHESDASRLWQLKYNTIHQVNCADYSQTQLDAWAPSGFDQARWLKRVSDMKPFVATQNELIVGFADLQNDGYIDHFFCHHLYVGQGIGSQLMSFIFKQAKAAQIKRLYSQVSISARPFFTRHGFDVDKAQQVNVNGIILDNFVMQRQLTS